MSMTPAQLATLAADLAADPVLSAIPNTPDGAFEIAAAYNAAAAPSFIVWKTTVSILDIMGNGFRWTDVDALAIGKARIWDWMTRLGTIDPSKPNIRQGLVDCWGAGTPQAVAIAPHLKRSATRAEKLFATGTGTTANPATMTFEGQISYQDIFALRNP